MFKATSHTRSEDIYLSSQFLIERVQRFQHQAAQLSRHHPLITIFKLIGLIFNDAVLQRVITHNYYRPFPWTPI